VFNDKVFITLSSGFQSNFVQVAKRRKARNIAESRLICMVADNGCSELMHIYRAHVATILTEISRLGVTLSCIIVVYFMQFV